MKYIIALITAVLFISLPSCVINNTNTQPVTTGNVTSPAPATTTPTATRISPNERVPRITVEELHQKMQENADILIIDARSGVEDLFAGGHIKDAIPVPLYRFTEGWSPSVPLDKEIVIYCT